MPKMTEKKESSPDSTTTNSSSSSESSERSGGSINGDTGVVIEPSSHLHLQVPPHQHSTDLGSASSSQSSPRSRSVDLNRRGERGSSSSSSLSMGQMSYREMADIQDEFKIVKILHDGSFSKILLAKQESMSSGGGSESRRESCSEERSSKSSSSSNNKYLVLKAIPSGGLFTEDFKRELGYNYFLSPHPNIVTSFNISFNWASAFNVYVQEHSPFGDLSRYIGSSNGAKKCLPECQAKLIASQIASALDFMHSFKLVHQDIQAENILIFKSNFSRVKLCDFGSTRREGTLITKGNLFPSSSSSLLPPELCYLLPQERFECHRSSDVWQMGILLCVCLTGSCPWDNADFSDPVFRQYTNWLKRKNLKVPEPFRKFSPRLVRLLKRLLEPKCHFRSEIREVFKYLSDDWVKPSYSSRNVSGSIISGGGGNNNASIKQKKGSMKKREACRTTTKNGKSKLIVLTSTGINLISGRLEAHKKEDKTGGGESSKANNDIHVVVKDEDSDCVEDESIMVKRVEHWVAAAAEAETCTTESSE